MRRCFMPARGVSSCIISSVPGEATKREDFLDSFETMDGNLPLVTPGGNGSSSSVPGKFSNEETGDKGLTLNRPLWGVVTILCC